MQESDFQNVSVCVLGDNPRDLAHAAFWVGSRSLEQVQRQLDRHRHVTYFCLETPLQEELIARKIAWQAVMMPLKVIAQPEWERMKQKIEEFHHAAHLLLSEVADFGIHAFKNAKINWKRNGPFFPWRVFQDQFQGVPAIICGAGPSLEEAIPLLSRLQSSALIFAAGTASSILNQNNIAPHLSFMLDKETPFSCIVDQVFAEVPCCIQSRLTPECVQFLHCAKILAPESGPLPWEQWWMESDKKEELGWTVGNFAAETAIRMGCNPIIWIGMDLCYRDRQKYAHHGQHGKDEMWMHGNFATQRDWLMAARFCEKQAQSHPQIQWINTAMNGLPLAPPIVTRPFQDVMHLFRKEFDLSGRLHQIFQCASLLDLNQEKKEVRWQESCQHCQYLVSQLNEEIDRPLENEIVYAYYLKPLWQIWQPIFEREAKGQNMDWHRRLFFQQVLQDVQ